MARSALLYLLPESGGHGRRFGRQRGGQAAPPRAVAQGPGHLLPLWGGGNAHFKSGNLSIRWSWAWSSPQERLVLAAAERAQSNLTTEQPTASLSEAAAAKDYCSARTESKFPPTDLRPQRESSQTEGHDSFPEGKDLRHEDFQTLSPDCLPPLQLLISNDFHQNNRLFFLIACSVFCPRVGFREEKSTWKYISKVQARRSGYVNLTSPTPWHTGYYCTIR